MSVSKDQDRQLLYAVIQDAQQAHSAERAVELRMSLMGVQKAHLL
jgi:hypothetical protein